MAISRRNNLLFSIDTLHRIQALISLLKRSKHTFAGKAEHSSSVSAAEKVHIDSPTCLALDSRGLGIKGPMISTPAWTILRKLRGKGFEAYLVGGCVRDLLLKRIPKDFDVVTTAKLAQIKKEFRCCHIVGKRFPICRVNIQDSIVEVSSFEITREHAEANRAADFSQRPSKGHWKDFLRWKNCLQRDFTINSLFFDPFANKIYDYADGIKDLRMRKVQTIIPAQMSFKKDCARILRGLRIAARLGWHFSRETASAIRDLSTSILNLDKSRLMMELNFMLAYGAAEPSFHLLHRFKLLEIMLPIHGAYLNEQAQPTQSSTMLMRLLSSMDKLLACDRHADCNLWVALLAFHLALLYHPQNAFVVWAFSSVLYCGNWTKAVEVAQENARINMQFIPEISDICESNSNESVLEGVSHLASLVKSSITALTSTQGLNQAMARYKSSPCSGLLIIPPKMGKTVAELFDVLENDLESYTSERENFDIDYKQLGKADQRETRFVLGKIIMDTMSTGRKEETARLQLAKLFV